MPEVTGFGTILEKAATTTTAFTTTDGWTSIGHVVEIEPPTVEADDIDTTHMQSTDGVRTYLPGLIEPGEATVTINYGTEVGDDPIVGTAGRWRVKYSDNTADGFDGYVKSAGKPVDMEGLVTHELTIKASGPISSVTVGGT